MTVRGTIREDIDYAIRLSRSEEEFARTMKELGYVFNYSRSGMLLTTVPITVKLSYLPVQTGKFDLALGLNLGGAFIRYDEGKYFAPVASVTLNPTFYFSETWGLGVETGLMVTSEFYGSNNAKSKASAFAGMMPGVLTLSYRH